MKASLPERADRVGIVATDPLRVLGLQAIFSEVLQLEIVHLSVPGALDDVSINLVLIDAECTPHLFELIATFRQVRPLLKLIVFGNESGEEYIQRIIGAGVKGYLALSSSESDIRMAIDMVRDGSVWAPRKVLSRLLDNQRAAASSPAKRPSFTPRELQVLTKLRAGQSNREIALSLGIDESTVKAHLGRLMRKVGVNNRIALTIHPFTQFQ
jgi:DNA-binding NarL/FixJ family response regulator